MGEWLGGKISGSQDFAQTVADTTQTNNFSTGMDWLAMVTGRIGFAAAVALVVFGLLLVNRGGRAR